MKYMHVRLNQLTALYYTGGTGKCSWLLDYLDVWSNVWRILLSSKVDVAKGPAAAYTFL